MKRTHIDGPGKPRDPLDSGTDVLEPVREPRLVLRTATTAESRSSWWFRARIRGVRSRGLSISCPGANRVVQSVAGLTLIG